MSAQDKMKQITDLEKEIVKLGEHKTVNSTNTSLIIWRTGEFNDDGYYLVTDRVGCVYVLWYRKGSKLSDSFENVIAWCPLNDIEPYKK